jgi:hypothetical protein
LRSRSGLYFMQRFTSFFSLVFHATDFRILFNPTTMALSQQLTIIKGVRFFVEDFEKFFAVFK